MVRWSRRLAWIRAAAFVTSDERDARRGSLAFYALALVALAAMYAHALRVAPGLDASGPRVIFTLLMLAHAYLHWRSPLVSLKPWLSVPYLVLQGALALLLSLLSGSLGLTIAVFSTLVGITIGTIHDRRVGLAASVAFIVLGVWSLGRLAASEDLRLFASLAVGLSLFAALYAWMYRRQVDARARAESLLEDLESAQALLAERAQRIEALTLAAERQRIARELHDTLAQGLAGLILQLEAMRAHLGQNHAERATEILDNALIRGRRALADARRAIEGLRAAAASRDLDAVIRQEAQLFAEASGIRPRLLLAASTGGADGTWEHIQAILREALWNVARHADADTVTLSVRRDGGQLTLEVEDDGCGFDPQELSTQHGHYGIAGMRERAHLARGSLSIERRAGGGTILRLALPAPTERTDE